MNTQKLMALLVASAMVVSCNNEESTTAYNEEPSENITYASLSSWDRGNDYDGSYNAIPDRDYAYVVEQEETVEPNMNDMESDSKDMNNKDADMSDDNRDAAAMSTKSWDDKSSSSSNMNNTGDEDYAMKADKVQEVPKKRYKSDNKTCTTSAKNSTWNSSTNSKKEEDTNTAVSITSTTYYAPKTTEKEHNRMDVLVGTWKNDDITIRMYDSGLAKEVIKNDGSTPQKTYVSWDVKGTDKELCLIESATGVENCYDMLVINQEELELYMYDEKVTLMKQ